jgi:hypothetical protein
VVGERSPDGAGQGVQTRKYGNRSVVIVRQWEMALSFSRTLVVCDSSQGKRRCEMPRDEEYLWRTVEGSTITVSPPDPQVRPRRNASTASEAEGWRTELHRSGLAPIPTITDVEVPTSRLGELPGDDDYSPSFGAVKCSRCEASLAWVGDGEKLTTIPPCPRCLRKKREEGFQAGYDDGFAYGSDAKEDKGGAG